MRPGENKEATMNCSEFEILLCDYVDGTLDAARKQALEAHQRGCAACAEFARDVMVILCNISAFGKHPRADADCSQRVASSCVNRFGGG